MSMEIPEEIGNDRVAAACTAFFDALGVPGLTAESVYTPMIVCSNQIHLLVVPTALPDGEYPPAVKVPEAEHPQGRTFGEYAIPIMIKVFC